MAQTNSRFFSVMVVGDYPMGLMEKYDLNKKGEMFVKYEYLKAGTYQKAAITTLEKLLSMSDKIGIEPNIVESMKHRLEVLKSMTSFEYYRELTDGMYYDQNGNALSEENLDGKWNTCRIGKNFCIPLKLKDGKEVYSSKSGEVDWESMHLANSHIYQAAWELVMEGREPENEEETEIYEAMKDKDVYFSKFENKEKYVAYGSSYWNYAYVDDNGWHDAESECDGDERLWVETFYDRYIKNMNPNLTVTIYECSTNQG